MKRKEKYETAHAKRAHAQAQSACSICDKPITARKTDEAVTCDQSCAGHLAHRTMGN